MLGLRKPDRRKANASSECDRLVRIVEYLPSIGSLVIGLTGFAAAKAAEAAKWTKPLLNRIDSTAIKVLLNLMLLLNLCPDSRKSNDLWVNPYSSSSINLLYKYRSWPDIAIYVANTSIKNLKLENYRNKPIKMFPFRFCHLFLHKLCFEHYSTLPKL